MPHLLLHLCSAGTLSRIASFNDGLTLNYRSGVVAKGFLWMAFSHTLFCSVLCHWISEMYEDEHLNVKNDHCVRVASASP